MFASRAIEDMPVRSYGKLFSDLTGKRLFEYRPWLVLPKRTLDLPPGDYAVGQGLLYPEVMRVDGEDSKTLFILPPRYKGHEADLAKACTISEIRDVGFRKGLKSIGRAMKCLFGVGQKQLPAPA
jgi:hypothetical protein